MRAAVPLAVLVALLASSGSANSATSTVIVDMSVVSATNLSVIGCPPAARTFGTVLPGTSSITTIDCSVVFGSSNDTSRIRVAQLDQTGSAMWAWSTTGAPDATWNAAPAGLREATPANGHGYGGLVIAPSGEVYKGARTTTVSLGVARFTSAGPLDTAWNGDGYAQVSVGAPAYPMDVALDSTGRILVAGSSVLGTEGLVVARMDTSGNADTSFGGSATGWMYVDPDPATTYTVPSTMWVASDGKLWISGCVTNTAAVPCMHANGISLFVVRLNADGTRDTGFGTNGVMLHTPAGQTANGKLVPTNEGGVVVMGRDAANVTMFKLRPDGKLDATFGTNGVVSTALPGVAGPVPWGGTTLADGALVTIGKNSTHTTTWIARWNANGSPDLTWGGGDGLVIHDLFPAVTEFPESNDLVPTGDGGGFLGGTYTNGAAEDYFVAKFLPDGSLDTAFGGGDGIATRSAANSGAQHGGLAASEGRLYVGGGTGRIQVVRFGGDGGSIPDYVHPGTNFGSASGAFGACLRTSSNATATWTPGPGLSCAGDGTHWKGIPRTTVSAGAEIATAATATTTAQVDLRFGVAASTTARGTFSAPISFEVVAP